MPTYVITGASSGLGLEMTKQLAARGAKVYATCRKKACSANGEDYISAVPGDVTIIEGVDVATDACKQVLAAALAGVTIDVLVHNAGSINGTRDVQGAPNLFGEQKLDAVSSERMLAAFQLNTLGPLRVQQALTAQMASPGGKVAIISTGFGSIGDNNSGGVYAYRVSKAAVNMVAKNLSCDLKEKGIAVTSVNPGMVQTEFGPGREAMTSMGAMPVAKSVKDLLQVFDELSMETTGSYMCVYKDKPPPLSRAGGESARAPIFESSHGGKLVRVVEGDG
eukprot:CAMPEP_0119359102 /NCGR_PEP_ID=MMETSP1334-20130426/7079_1 /TAXON_ID=127549 /ORGANISM="Calcidiscus leptoporus, Strain RCC1130" /LENGTH=278 /DNA_ID=CAMNT_0007373707 /DNA_START=16 /DNA_END=853 /DNA_ORIENTATION=-